MHSTELVAKLAASFPVSIEMLEDSPTLRRMLELRMAGFGLRRCSECGRRLRCVYVRPDPRLGWRAPRLLGSTCYRKVTE
jgi:hypothetical protein